MQKDFDMKLMILKIKRLECDNKIFKQKLNIKNDDPIFKKEDPERIITIRKKKLWKKAKQGLNLTHVINTLKKQKMTKPELELTIQ